MFILTIHDRKGIELNEGDIVKISDGKYFKFYSEVKYLEKEKAIAPFHTFCFHSVEKVDSVPDTAKPGNEERYKIWYECDPEEDIDYQDHDNYLREWRDCERMIGSGMFNIKRQ